MSTRAAIFIPLADGRWAEVYNHYDGSPERMLPALEAHDPSDILAAQELRSITPDAIEPFAEPNLPTHPDDGPYFPSWASHVYILTIDGWKWAASPDKITAILH